MKWLGLGRRQSKPGKPETPVLREPEARLVDVFIYAGYAAAVRNRLGPMIVDQRPSGEDIVALTFEFDATSDEIAERMARRAVERVGLDDCVVGVRRRRSVRDPAYRDRQMIAKLEGVRDQLLAAGRETAEVEEAIAYHARRVAAVEIGDRLLDDQLR